MITGYTFDRAKVTAFQDSTLYDFLNFGTNTVIPNVGSDMAVTTNGLTCTIAPGKAVICGRLIEIASAEDVQVTASSTGYLCLTVDLSQVNTSSGTPGQTDYTFVINQVRAEFVTSLTQDDLFDGGLLYNFPLGTVTSTATTVSFTPTASSYARAPISIANGGTGASTAIGARTNLEVLKPYFLYNSSSGTTGAVNLSDSLANYTMAEIYYTNEYGNYNSIKAYNPSGKTLSMVANHYGIGGGQYLDICGEQIVLGTTTISRAVMYVYTITTSGISFSSAGSMKIYQVIGYKF